MKTNRIYSILSKGLPYGNSEFSRFVQENAYAYENDEGRDMIEALTPYSDEYLRAVYAEYLTQFLWNSEQGDRARTFDPDNSYETAFPLFGAPGEYIIPTTVPDPFSVDIVVDYDVLRERGQGRVDLLCVVDSSAGTLTYRDTVFNYTVTNGMSSKIGIVPGLSIRMRSDFASLFYIFTIRATLPAALDWNFLRDRVSKTRPVWTDPSLARIWEEDPRWDQRLAAYVMSAVELFNRA